VLPAAAQFGKNKVQYERFRWQYIQSRHLDVYFAQDGEYLARFAAIVGERALESIQQTLGHRLTRRISLIVYNSHVEFQQTNVVWEFLPEGVGGVTELFKNRVVVPFEGNYELFRPCHPPRARARGAQRYVLRWVPPERHRAERTR
jgi:hypothetical protein